MDSKPHCATCGKDVAEVLCPECGKWWADNPPVPAPDLVDRAAEAIFHEAGGLGWEKANQDYYRRIARAIIPIIQADHLSIAQLKEWVAEHVGLGGVYDDLCDAEQAIAEAQARYDTAIRERNGG